MSSAAPAVPPEGAGPWSDLHLMAAVNRMRAAQLPPAGASWVQFHALHPENTNPAHFLAVGGPEEACEPARLERMRILRDGLAAGGIDWPAWEVRCSSRG